MDTSPHTTRTLAEGVAACLASAGAEPFERLVPLVSRLRFDDQKPPAADDLPPEPDDTQMLQLQQDPLLQLKLDLVYGGATRVKEYVFEAPKLPEIRGASALLDYVTNTLLESLWRREVGQRFVQVLGLSRADAEDYAAACMIYAGGGNFLAVAPRGMGVDLAEKIEQTYTDWTLNAPCAAVALEAMLIELRYGRLQPTAAGAWYWLDQALRDWAAPDLTEAFDRYYYVGEAASRADRFYQRKTFGELVALLAQRFYRRREERAYQHGDRALPLYAVSPLDTRCSSSGVRPVTWSGAVGNDNLALSPASARKRFFGHVTKADPNVEEQKNLTNWFVNSFDWSRPRSVTSWQGWLDSNDMHSWQRQWEDYLQGAGHKSNYAQAAKHHKMRPALEISEIARGSKRYIGMIYADGNNIARYMAVAKTPQQYQDQAGKLTDAAQNAVFSALGHCLQPLRFQGSEWLHPFEILTIGGDDLLLLVPGDRALDIALRIGREFEREMGAAQPRTLHGRYAPPAPLADFAAYTSEIGLSAGVVIAPETTPIFFLRDLAEELLKNAKKLARKRSKHDPTSGGAIDFMVLRSITMVSNRISTFREEALGDDAEPNYQTIRLTARPYNWPELAGLLDTARKLQAAGLPRSQLYRLRAILEQARPSGGVTPSMIDYLNTRSRLSRDARDALKRHVELDWRGFSPSQPNTLASAIPPWLRMERGGWETIWPDLTEIYDLLAREEI